MDGWFSRFRRKSETELRDAQEELRRSQEAVAESEVGLHAQLQRLEDLPNILAADQAVRNEEQADAEEKRQEAARLRERRERERAAERDALK